MTFAQHYFPLVIVGFSVMAFLAVGLGIVGQLRNVRDSRSAMRRAAF